MKSIRILSKEVINEIAAGEIVESPVSIVKELVENSLDAGASNIKIELINGGTDQIRVIDDGHGMGEADLKKSVLKHSTNKILEKEDILKISTLGFRGEALHAIGLVSKLTIKSKLKNNLAGHMIIVNQGQVGKVNPVGMPEGTEIIVQQLFADTPARKKFLKDSSQYLKDISLLLLSYGVAYPKACFYLINNSKQILYLPPDETLKQRALELFSLQENDSITEIDHTQAHVSIKGFSGLPKVASSNATQLILVNGRPVTDAQIKKHVKHAYKSLIMPKENPPFVLLLQMPPELVDVNVHPQKSQVRFSNTDSVLLLVGEAITQALENSGVITAPNEQDTYNFTEAAEFDPLTAQKLKDSTETWNYKTNQTDNCTEILQVKKLYLIYETNKGIEIVDQHAAHERILYEDFVKSFSDSVKNLVKLKTPIKLKLPAHKRVVLKKLLKPLENIGFEFEHIQQDWQISKMPKLYEKRNVSKLIEELIDEFDSHPTKKEVSIDRLTVKTISHLACKSAIRSGDYLTQEERKNLIFKLNKTKTGYSCPHGRPVKAKLSENELKRLFKR